MADDVHLKLSYVHAHNVFISDTVFTVSFCMEPPQGDDKGKPPKAQKVFVKVSPHKYFLDLSPIKNTDVKSRYYEVEFKLDKDYLTAHAGEVEDGFTVTIDAWTNGSNHTLEPQTAYILKL